MRRVLFIGAVLLLLPNAARAQNSIYAVRGLGIPTRQLSPRARSLGGAFGVFDATSAINPAAVASVTSLAASGSYGTTIRDYTAEGVTATDLKDTRFPLGMLAGSFGSKPFAFAVSFASLTERTYDISTTAVDTISGLEIDVADRIRQDGGVNDIRGAVGWRLSPNFQLGAALHLITGSMRVQARREFLETQLQVYDEESQVSFSGIGFSAGLQWAIAQRIRVAFSARLDSDMKTTVAERSKSSRTTTKIPLPLYLNGGVLWDLAPQLQWTVSGDWTSWSRAEGHLDPQTLGTFDSWGVGTGIQYGALNGVLPVRLGARYGTLPFSPSATEQPTEFILSAGLGTQIARGRLAVDFSGERLIREGANASERAWHLLLGITVRP